MRRREKTLKVTKHLVLFIGAIIMLVPFAWMILTAFKTNTEAMQMNPFVIFPSEWRTESFVSVAEKMDFICEHTFNDSWKNYLCSVNGNNGGICFWKIEI